jgi:acyl-CoA synthetase (AMP-forming)/AMP-acid ligase II
MVINEQGKPCKPGEPGILVHRGPTVSLGYWQRPEETAKVLRPNPLKSPHQGVDTVCYSGDLVRTDEEGFLYFVGRNDAMIKSGGYRISPTEVEEALMAGGAFRQVAVIGLPDDVLGNRVHAVAVGVTDNPNATTESVAECLRRCARALPAFMVPREIELVSMLPLSPNGKTDYKALRAQRS